MYRGCFQLVLATLAEGRIFDRRVRPVSPEIAMPAPRQRALIDLDHLVVTRSFGLDGERIQVRDLSDNLALVATLTPDLAAAMYATLLHAAAGSSVSAFADRLNQAIAESAYAIVVRRLQGSEVPR